jgi:hypothetical protein
MTRRNAEIVARIVRDAGGRIVGRTRLQKTAYLLMVSGLESGLSFSYRYYGPFSEDLATAADEAELLGLIKEKCRRASWGGTFSIYEAAEPADESVAQARLTLALEAARADPIELELAATAVFLFREGQRDPWAETARRKPEKAQQGRLERSKELYRKLQEIDTPVKLPVLR